MKKELYKEGHFIKVLEADIEALKNSDDIKIDFNTPKDEYNKFQKTLNKNFEWLHHLLFEYTISGLNEDKYYDKIGKAVDNIIASLHSNFDIDDSFYEDKLNLFETYFKEYPEKLIKTYPEFKIIFSKLINSISCAFILFDFVSSAKLEEYLLTIEMYNDFHSNLHSANFCPKTKEYMIHCTELLLKDIEEMLVHEVFHYKENDQKKNENKIRKIVYLLKTQLNLDVE